MILMMMIIIMNKQQYVKRHDRVCVKMHFTMHKEIGVKLDKAGMNMHPNLSK